MSMCIYCNEEIDETNRSLEHLFPNGIGGTLKSKDLACTRCNCTFGSEIDNELVNQLNHVANMLNVKRDRGVPQRIKAEHTGENIDYYIEPGGKPVMSKPIIRKKVSGEELQICIGARNISEARKILKGLKRKHPDLNVEKILERAENRKEYVDNYLSFNLSVGGANTFRSIAKIAYNYFRYKNQSADGSYLNEIINYIMGKLPDKNLVWFYYKDREVIDKNSNEVLHSVVIKGNNKHHYLYAYVELFNAFRFIVLLSNSYSGSDYIETYSFNVVDRKEVAKDVNIALSLDEIKNILLEKPQFESLLKNEYEKLLPIILNKQRHEHNEELIDKALKNSLLKYPKGVVVTEAMLNEFVQEFMKEITPLITQQLKEGGET